MLHSPYTIKNEQKLDKKYLAHFAFAEQKLDELRELKEIAQSANYKDNVLYKNNVALFENKPNRDNKKVQERVENLQDKDYKRFMISSSSSPWIMPKIMAAKRSAEFTAFANHNHRFVSPNARC